MQRLHVVLQVADHHGVRLIERDNARGVPQHPSHSPQTQRAIGIDRHEQPEQPQDLQLAERLAVHLRQPFKPQDDRRRIVADVPQVAADPGEVLRANQRGINADVPGGGKRCARAVDRASQDRVQQLRPRHLEVHVLGHLLAPRLCRRAVHHIPARSGPKYPAGAAGEGGRRGARVADHLVLDLDVPDRLPGRVGVARTMQDGGKARGGVDRDRRRVHLHGGRERRRLQVEDVLAGLPLDVVAGDPIGAPVECRLFHDLRADHHEVAKCHALIAEVEPALLAP